MGKTCTGSRRWIAVFRAGTFGCRVLLVVGDEQPQEAYIFDLVGAYPRIPFHNEEDFLKEIVWRMVTVASTRTVSQHQMQGEPIPRQVWEALTAPRAMMQASRAFALPWCVSQISPTCRARSSSRP